MMVSTICLLVIVLGLTAMFIQTQRAFKIGLKQNDIADNGRTVVELIARDLSQMISAQSTSNLNCVFVSRTATNLIAVIQNDANGSPIRTNELEDIFTINRVGAAWQSIGYAVSNALPNSSIGVGTLYRYAPPVLDGSPTNRPPPLSPEGSLALNAQYNGFLSPAWMTNRVADGIIHLQIRAYDINGVELPFVTNGNFVSLSFPFVTNDFSTGVAVPKISTNLPASLELELGILEPEALEHVRAIGVQAAQVNYLAGRAGQVQIYRQQIPIKTANR